MLLKTVNKLRETIGKSYFPCGSEGDIEEELQDLQGIKRILAILERHIAYCYGEALTRSKDAEELEHTMRLMKAIAAEYPLEQAGWGEDAWNWIGHPRRH